MPDRYGKYSYFDSPDGKDGPKKMWYISKNMAKLGLLSATAEAFGGNAVPQTRLAWFAVYSKHVAVLVGVGLAYTCGTFISTDLRGKDDPSNHCVGAFAACAVAGAVTANPMVFSSLALVSLPLSYFNKYSITQGDSPWNLREQTKNVRPLYRTSHLWEPLPYNGKNDRSLQDRYDEKNEEFYRKFREGSRV